VPRPYQQGVNVGVDALLNAANVNLRYLALLVDNCGDHQPGF
jgi:hypothetical protein